MRNEDLHIEDVNLDILQQCIKEGLPKINKARDKEIVLVLGNTGSGKSTTINYLLDCEMSKTKIKGIDRIKTQGKSFATIGHSVADAETQCAEIWHEENKIIYCDTPGFLDTKGKEQRVWNSISIQLMVKVARIKGIIVIVNRNDFTTTRSKSFKKLGKLLGRIFSNPATIMQSLLFVVTHVDPKNEDELNEIELGIPELITEIINQQNQEETRLKENIKKNGRNLSDIEKMQENKKIKGYQNSLYVLKHMRDDKKFIIVDFLDNGNSKRRVENYLGKSLYITEQAFNFNSYDDTRDKFEQALNEIIVKGTSLIQDKLIQPEQIKMFQGNIENMEKNKALYIKSIEVLKRQQKAKKDQINQINDMQKEILDNDKLIYENDKKLNGVLKQIEQLRTELISLDSSEAVLYWQESVQEYRYFRNPKSSLTISGTIAVLAAVIGGLGSALVFLGWFLSVYSLATVAQLPPLEPIAAVFGLLIVTGSIFAAMAAYGYLRFPSTTCSFDYSLCCGLRLMLEKPNKEYKKQLKANELCLYMDNETLSYVVKDEKNKIYEGPINQETNEDRLQQASNINQLKTLLQQEEHRNKLLYISDYNLKGYKNALLWLFSVTLKEDHAKSLTIPYQRAYFIHGYSLILANLATDVIKNRISINTILLEKKENYITAYWKNKADKLIQKNFPLTTEALNELPPFPTQKQGLHHIRGNESSSLINKVASLCGFIKHTAQGRDKVIQADRMQGKYHVKYFSGAGRDGIATVEIYVEKREIPDNHRRIIILKEKLEKKIKNKVFLVKDLNTLEIKNQDYKLQRLQLEQNETRTEEQIALEITELENKITQYDKNIDFLTNELDKAERTLAEVDEELKQQYNLLKMIVHLVQALDIFSLTNVKLFLELFLQLEQQNKSNPILDEKIVNPARTRYSQFAHPSSNRGSSEKLTEQVQSEAVDNLNVMEGLRN